MPILVVTQQPAGTDDYLYQYNGLDINGNSLLPFIDVDKVSGLDVPDIPVTTVDLDGVNGSLNYAQFAGSRTISIDGTAYTSPVATEDYIDQIIGAFMPRASDLPFSFKHPGASKKYINCKPLPVKFDIETLRRTGQTAIQIQLIANDPLKYLDNGPVTITSGSQFNVNNTGKAATAPKLIVTGTYTKVVMTSSTGDVTFTYNQTNATATTIIDCGSGTVAINGTQRNAGLTSTSGIMPTCAPGPTSFTVTITGSATAKLYTANGWL